MKITPKYRLQGWGLSAYASTVWRTARYQAVGLEHILKAEESGRPIIIPAWHGMTMVFAGYLVTRLRHNLVAIVPDDHRGAVLSIAIRNAGADVFTISMEATSLVAARRLLALIRQLKQGKTLAMNPDGPDGPTHVPKEGVAYIARKSNSLLIPGAAFTTTCFHIPRWDRYVVPFPFSRITVVFGTPLDLTSEPDDDAARALLRDRLNEVELAAERFHRQRT
jgi:lysophospholipid acyltransferase (LPLAT)-like uncharacterized protein